MKIKFIGFSLLAMVCVSALALESSASSKPAKSAQTQRRIAVLYFRDTTSIDALSSRQSYLSPALGTMLSTDLSGMAGVEMVERESVDALLMENKLGEAALTDETSAQKLGQTVSADVILMGTLRTGNGFVRILPALFYVAESKREKLAPIEIDQTDLFGAEAKVLAEVTEALKLKPAPEPAAVATDKAGANLAVLDLVDNSPPASGDTLSASVADLLSNALSDSPRFKLVDRTQIHKVIEEQKLNLGGLTRDKALQTGKVLGAQLFVLASYTRSKGDLRIDVRLVHPESSRVLATLKEQGPERSAALIAKKLGLRILKFPMSNLAELPKPASQATPTQVPQRTSTSTDVAPPAEQISDENLEAQFTKTDQEFKQVLMNAFSRQPYHLFSFYPEDQIWTPEIKAKLEDFARQYKRFAYLRPKNAKYRSFCGECLFEIGQYAAAREEFDAAEKVGADPMYTKLNHGECLIREKKYQEAAEYYEKFAEDLPQFRSHGLSLAAKAWGLQGNIVKKRELIKQALTVEGLAEWEFRLGRGLDVGAITSQKERRLVREQFLNALNLDPTYFRAFVDYVGQGDRFSMELDSYVQAKKTIENLKEPAERAGVTYIYFLPPRQIAEWNAEEQCGFRNKPQPIDGDRDYRVDYKAGKGVDPKDEFFLEIGEGGYVTYKFKMPGAKRARLNVEGSDIISISPDGVTWTKIQENLVPMKPAEGDERFLNPHYYMPIEIGGGLAADGTIFVKFETHPGRISKIAKVTAIGMPK